MDKRILTYDIPSAIVEAQSDEIGILMIGTRSEMEKVDMNIYGCVHPSRLNCLNLIADPGYKKDEKEKTREGALGEGGTFDMKPWAFSLSSAPMKRRKWRTEGMRLSPT